MQEEIETQEIKILGTTCWYCGEVQSIEAPRETRWLALVPDSNTISENEIRADIDLNLPVVPVHKDEFKAASKLAVYLMEPLTEPKDRRKIKIPESWWENYLDEYGSLKELYLEDIEKASKE